MAATFPFLAPREGLDAGLEGRCAPSGRGKCSPSLRRGLVGPYGLDAELVEAAPLFVAELVEVAVLGGEPASDVLAVPGHFGGDRAQARALGLELGEVGVLPLRVMAHLLSPGFQSSSIAPSASVRRRARTGSLPSPPGRRMLVSHCPTVFPRAMPCRGAASVPWTSKQARAAARFSAKAASAMPEEDAVKGKAPAVFRLREPWWVWMAGSVVSCGAELR
ncbi:hypothetical protein [Streptomyces sp. NPDC002082]|uniref:hypothetical protein n=1 Tax=Streptomyces sp. NPDC002082 TaxID=3154772 RepID=UPI0033192430